MLKYFIFFICLFFPLSVHADDSTLLKSFYETIINHRAEPITAEQLTIEALDGLSDIDKNLLFANGKEMVYLYYKRRQIALWHKPKDENNLNSWVEISLNAINTAIKFSPSASHNDFQILEKIMTAATNGLNDGSHYYSELSKQDDEKNTSIRPFARRLIDDVLYLRIGNFNASTKQNILDALSDYPQAKGVILDLRGNRGGLLTAAIDVASIFIDGGIITSVEGRDKKAVKYYNADENSNFILPMVTLIDGQTASSAEVVAAALLEQIQAKIIGTNSFGKGSIQEMYRFENGGKLALTTAHFYTPSGQKIDRIGLIPDYCTTNIGDSLPSLDISSYTNLSCTKENRMNNNADVELALILLNQDF